MNHQEASVQRGKDIQACNAGEMFPHDDVLDLLMENGIPAFAIYESKREGFAINELEAEGLYAAWFIESGYSDHVWYDRPNVQSFIEHHLGEHRLCDCSDMWCLDLLEQIKQET